MAKSGRQLSLLNRDRSRRLLAVIEMRGRRRCQMSAGGEAPNADALRINAKLLGLRPHGADGTLHVEHRPRLAVAA